MEETTTNKGMTATQKVLTGAAIGLGALFVLGFIGSILPDGTVMAPLPAEVVETVIDPRVEWVPEEDC